MSEFDDSEYQSLSIEEMQSLIKTNWRQAWNYPVRVSGYLRVTVDSFSYLSEDQDLPHTIVIQGPLLRDALELNTRGWSLAGGRVEFAGPATIWSNGFSQVPIPGFVIRLNRPVRLRFASRRLIGPPNEPVEITLPQPSSSQTSFEILRRGDFASLVRLLDDYSISMLLNRRGIERLADCFIDVEEILQTLCQNSRDVKGDSTNHELIAKAEMVCHVLQSSLREYEQFCRENGLPLRYGEPISERKIASEDK